METLATSTKTVSLTLGPRTSDTCEDEREGVESQGLAVDVMSLMLGSFLRVEHCGGRGEVGNSLCMCVCGAGGCLFQSH
jgi:hypothetical protein